MATRHAGIAKVFQNRFAAVIVFSPFVVGGPSAVAAMLAGLVRTVQAHAGEHVHNATAA